MKIAIVGSRDFPSIPKVYNYVAGLPPDTVVVSGGARGVDAWAAKFARNRGLPEPLIFEADWVNRGLGAGKERNHQIVEACDRLVAFWDGSSRGTADTIELARKAGKPVEIIDP